MKATPEDILASAETLVAERGFDRTSVSDIAIRTGVASGTVLYHYRSKEGILAELAQRHLVSLHMSCRSQCDREGTGLERLGMFIEAVFQHLRRSPAGWRIFFREIATNRLNGQAKLHEQLEAAGRLPLILLENLVIFGQGDGSIGPRDPYEVANAVWAVLMGCVWSVLFQDCSHSVMADNASTCVHRLLAGYETNPLETTHWERSWTCSGT